MSSSMTSDDDEFYDQPESTLIVKSVYTVVMGYFYAKLESEGKTGEMWKSKYGFS